MEFLIGPPLDACLSLIACHLILHFLPAPHLRGILIKRRVRPSKYFKSSSHVSQSNFLAARAFLWNSFGVFQSRFTHGVFTRGSRRGLTEIELTRLHREHHQETQAVSVPPSSTSFKRLRRVECYCNATKTRPPSPISRQSMSRFRIAAYGVGINSASLQTSGPLGSRLARKANGRQWTEFSLRGIQYSKVLQ